MNDDFDVSEGEDSDFEGNGVYSYRSDAFGAISNIEELNSSPLPAIASGDEEPLSSDSEWLPSLQQFGGLDNFISVELLPAKATTFQLKKDH